MMSKHSMYRGSSRNLRGIHRIPIYHILHTIQVSVRALTCLALYGYHSAHMQSDVLCEFIRAVGVYLRILNR